MGMAGAERIFGLLDEKPEEDEGYVTLVNAVEILTELFQSTKNVPVSGHGNIPTAMERLLIPG